MYKRKIVIQSTHQGVAFEQICDLLLIQTRPTHITQYSSTTIDCILASNPDWQIQSGVLQVTSSEYSTIYTVLDIQESEETNDILLTGILKTLMSRTSYKIFITPVSNNITM